MEPETISKNGASPKSQTIRRNQVNMIFAIALVLLFMLLITVCSSNSSQSISVNKNLIGVWEGDRISIVFFDNGTYYGRFDTQENFNGGRYSIYDNVIMLTRNISGGYESSHRYTFSISGNTLTLIEYEKTSEVTFKKVK